MADFKVSDIVIPFKHSNRRMSTEGIKPFCTECLAEWDRPWHDVCPACGHRFKGLPWWRSLWLVPLLVALPAAGLWLASVSPLTETESRLVDLILWIALGGSGVVVLPAAAVLASRLPWSTAMRVVMWILFVVLLYACALGLCVVIGGHYFNRIE